MFEVYACNLCLKLMFEFYFCLLQKKKNRFMLQFAYEKIPQETCQIGALSFDGLKKTRQIKAGV